MLGILEDEEVMCELRDHEKKNSQGLPPGFRFHPTDEELITFYLASKVFKNHFTNNLNFAEVDLNRCEPWELPEVAKMGEREWYLFSLRDRKYPTGLRTNRATSAGYWKATGKDKEVYSGSNGNGGNSRSTSSLLLGMKKTLVFYKGRAPRGEKTKWVMHEYRLHSSSHNYNNCTKEEWVICRIFHKSVEKRNSLLLQLEGHNYYSTNNISNFTPKKTCLPLPLPLPNNFNSFTTTQLDQNDHQFSSHTIFQPCSFPIKQSNIPKTEATFYDYHQSQSLILDDASINLKWINVDHANNFENSSCLFPPVEMDGAATNITHGEFKDIIMNSRVDAPTMGIDSHSWPHAQLV